ncbi:entericidin A/B family lipoprotein [Rubrimonas cliftonensis]|uniref:Predicted small secreted protein n=1 Tax=Rubrimonas cliftonensis TaxID=89524 RepID=A0A1H4CG71_9RHOB|nr:entericidin A/B family lipoprotein [Rubrimonas cliftonensis]SEA59401.1 Predicted small secreted protein [Rubrimonas cliftonensis]
MKTLFALLTALGALSVAACNTVEGAGRDISAGGEAVSDTARDVETEISQ